MSGFDLFGGSGSTLIACEKTGRVCRMMELSPRYCDVIVRRWQDFTGQEATLEDGGRTFAKQNENQEEHNKIWDKLDKHDTRITRLETFSKL